ncbi:uncharacterized protein At5g50100, chloroplastic [Aplysia californica]|uniref:Uncharacterized protein At5g50100, chloroplastic n=1 Tax=Aplysia californica TaxID=6500 RepID=A0ABM1VTT4_APLCA|nr:uncharacterized protein At5g50100, chloroplastic [Aplysia californica]XP_012938325.1 uncharacterized protein At5g50100, chloroplastic [Aplysia californica]XP_035825826.1 uncharacterized protein At5g50100, chloroplastic [Aplysia californica]
MNHLLPIHGPCLRTISKRLLQRSLHIRSRSISSEGRAVMNSLFCQVQNNNSLHKRCLCQSAGLGKSDLTGVTKVLYDGECRLCEIEISALKRFSNGKGAVLFTDITQPEYDPQGNGGVTYERAMKEMHVIAPDGQVLTQGDAIRQMYRACGLGWVAKATELPGIRSVCDRLYVHFAEYRLNKALDRCDGNSCSIKLQHLREKYRNSSS